MLAGLAERGEGSPLDLSSAHAPDACWSDRGEKGSPSGCACYNVPGRFFDHVCGKFCVFIQINHFMIV